jgi:MFS superfamily sulfate permease-like transporter
VAAVPPGLPRLALPPVSWSTIQSIAPVAAAIALVAAADTSVLSRAFPGREGTPAPPNRELAALGMANLAAGLLQGFPVSSSSTRTPVVAAAGGRSQLAGLVAAGGVAAVIAWAPAAVSFVPKAALAAVVIAACVSLIDVRGMVRLARIRRGEFAVSAVCMAGVVALGVLPGIMLAVAVALANFIWRSWRPHDAVLCRVDGVKGYHDVARHPEGHQIPGLVLFRWDSPLFFANAGMFRERLLDVVAHAPTPTRRVIVAAEPITDIDTTAAETLCHLAEELRARDIELGFAELKGPVKDMLRRYGIYESFDAVGFAPTLGRAVSTFVNRAP